MNQRIGVLLIACLVGGCGASPEQRSAGQGAAVGGLATLALCKALGGSDRTCIATSTAATVAGGVIGYKYADSVQQRRRALAGKEDDLDARIVYVRGLNAETESFNAQLAKQVSETSKHVADTEQKLHQGRLSQAQLMKTRTDLDDQVRAADAQVQAGHQELEDIKRFRAQQSARQSGELDAQVRKLETLLTEAQRNTTALASLRQRI